MKTVFCLAVIAGSLLASDTALADWQTQRYFQCAVTKRYTARAKLRPPGETFFSQTYDGGCTYAETDLSSFAVNNDPNGCAYSWARADGNDWNQRTGYANCGWAWGDNTEMIPAIYSMTPMYSEGERFFENRENLTAARLDDKGIRYDEQSRTISVNDMTGFLKVESRDLKNNYSTFQIKVYTFVMKNGEAVPDKVLWFAKASVINGELLLEGNFSRSDFKEKKEGDSREYEISHVSKMIPLGAGIDIENVCVEVAGDGGNLGAGITDYYAPNLQSADGKAVAQRMLAAADFNFEVASNPGSGKVVARIMKNTAQIVPEKICVMGFDGTVKKEIRLSAATENVYEIDVQDLPPGAYVFSFQSGNNFYSRKFIR